MRRLIAQPELGNQREPSPTDKFWFAATLPMDDTHDIHVQWLLNMKLSSNY